MDCIACQAPLSMGFFRQEYWSGLPFLLGITSQLRDRTHVSRTLALAGGFFTTSATARNRSNVTQQCRPWTMESDVCIDVLFQLFLGSPGGSVVKNPPASATAAGETGSIPRSGRSPGGGNGTPLQWVILAKIIPQTEDPGRQHTVHGVAKSWTQLSISVSRLFLAVWAGVHHWPSLSLSFLTCTVMQDWNLPQNVRRECKWPMERKERSLDGAGTQQPLLRSIFPKADYSSSVNGILAFFISAPSPARFPFFLSFFYASCSSSFLTVSPFPALDPVNCRGRPGVLLWYD